MRLALKWLMVGAFVLRSIVPVGFMIAPASAHGHGSGVTIVVCPGHMTAESGQKHKPHQTLANDASSPWAHHPDHGHAAHPPLTHAHGAKAEHHVHGNDAGQPGHHPGGHDEPELPKTYICPFAATAILSADAGMHVPLALTVHYVRLEYLRTQEVFSATPAPSPRTSRGPPLEA